MTKQEAIEVLSEIRSGYNCFIEEERPFYKALSVAIEVLSAQEKPYLWQKEMVKILSAQLDNNSTEVDNRNDELSCSEEPNRSDVISRQDAIYYVKQATIGETDVMKAWVKAQTHLMRLPSAQTDLSGYSDRLWKTAYDRGYERCRQDAIDALQKEIDEGIPPFNDAGIRCGVRFASSIIEDLPSAQPETFEWCHDCKEYDQENYCCHRWSQQIRKTVAELEANYPQEIKDELEYWKKRAEEAEADYIRVTGIRKYVPNIDPEEVEEDEIN